MNQGETLSCKNESFCQREGASVEARQHARDLKMCSVGRIR